MKRWLAYAAVMAWGFAAHAFEAPLTYARSEVKIIMQHPVNPKAGNAMAFDTEIRSADSGANIPGWYNFASLSDNKAAMLAYAEPSTAIIEAYNDFAPTDILFVNPYGMIKQILPSLVAAELQENVTSPEPVLAVMYLKGGTCAKLGIQPGDQVEYGLFKKKPVMISAPENAPAPLAAASSSSGASTSSSSSSSSSSGGADRERLIDRILRRQAQ